MSRRALLLLIVVLIAHLPQLLFSDWHGTEGRRVQIATEMAVSGNWMVPTLGWEPTYAKPPLHYWMLASVQRLFGDGFLAMRVPTLVGLWLLSVLGLELLRWRFGSAAGWVAALGIVVDQGAIRARWDQIVDEVLQRATLTRPADGPMRRGGRVGRHTEHLGHLLAVMQSVARAHPGATW